MLPWVSPATGTSLASRPPPHSWVSTHNPLVKSPLQRIATLSLSHWRGFTLELQLSVSGDFSPSPVLSRSKRQLEPLLTEGVPLSFGTETGDFGKKSTLHPLDERHPGRKRPSGSAHLRWGGLAYSRSLRDLARPAPPRADNRSLRPRFSTAAPAGGPCRGLLAGNEKEPVGTTSPLASLTPRRRPLD